MSLAVFKDNHVTLFGNKYFVANALAVSMGCHGDKATPIFGQNKLEPKGTIPAPKLQGKILTAPPISIDSTSSKSSDFMAAVSASLKVIGFNGTFHTVYNELVKQHLKFVELQVQENDMKRAANESPAALDDLRSYGAGARIAHRILVVMEASWATSFTSATTFDVTVNAGVLSIQAKGGASVTGKDMIRLEPGTCLAYLLLKLDWNKGKTQIETTHVDEWSFN